MKLDKEYCICSFCGTDYLMPIGQNIADFRRGMKLNESSSLLLRFLKEEHSFAEIVEMFRAQYQIPPEETEELQSDLRQTAERLIRMGYLCDGQPYAWLREERCLSKYQIGPFVIGINGPEQLVHSFMKAFAISGEARPVDQQITLQGGKPERCVNGEVILRNSDLVLMDAGQFYVFLFPGYEAIHELQVEKNGSKGVCYYQWLGKDREEELREQIFHALRFPFLLLAGSRQVYAVHSASLLYGGKAWLFSGQSGTGKSTHVSLWQEVYGVPALNGDLNLIGFCGGEPVVYGIPWCGTSETYAKETYPLGGIAFLRQAKEDRVEEPDDAEAAVLLVNRIIYPVWTEETMQKVAVFAENSIKKAGIYRVFCTKDKNAAIVVKEKIDSQA